MHKASPRNDVPVIDDGTLVAVAYIPLEIPFTCKMAAVVCSRLVPPLPLSPVSSRFVLFPLSPPSVPSSIVRLLSDGLALCKTGLGMIPR